MDKISDEEIIDKIKKLEKQKQNIVSGGSAVLNSNAANVKAGSHDDNEEFASYQEYCKTGPSSVVNNWKIDERCVIKVVDNKNQPVCGKLVSVLKKNNKLWSAATQASGEINLFPIMDLDNNFSSIKDYTIEIDNKSYSIQPSEDSYITIQLDTLRKVNVSLGVQICFLLDATGSMDDEIQMLKDVIFSIHERLLSHPSHPDIDFSVVAYRDKGDKYLVKGSQFTNSIDTFQMRLESIEAKGGGDEPEDLDAGLRYVLDTLKWDNEAAKFVFLIADAPPHLDYRNAKNYMWASRMAREKAIMITPVGASGLKELGEFIFRQIAVLTNGEFVFLHYGEKAESSGGGTVADPGKVSHHTGSNYTARRLDDIVIDIITKELGYLVDDPNLVKMIRKPQDESDLLDVRLQNLLQQVFRSELALKGKTVAISPFCILDTTLRPTSDYLWETALEKSMEIAPVKVVERTRMEEILKEHALELSGLMVENPDPKIGKMLSADYMVFGKIHYIGAVRVCHMRMVDCATGSIVSASRIKL
jgi:uncharacterized protein YegL